jgi:hypothetical protein
LLLLSLAQVLLGSFLAAFLPCLLASGGLLAVNSLAGWWWLGLTLTMIFIKCGHLYCRHLFHPGATFLAFCLTYIVSCIQGGLAASQLALGSQVQS